MDEATKAFFRRQQEDPENQTCVDGGGADPQWASVSHGSYISLESSGVHRSLGVHISFVRSTTMDSWKPSQLRLMELGGNGKLKAFFRQHGVPDNAPITHKYNTRAAEWYRKSLRALAEGTDPPPPLPEGTGHLPMSEEPSVAQVALAQSPPRSMMSAGGAFASDARHYGGYHGGGTYHLADVSNDSSETRRGSGATEMASSPTAGSVISSPSFAGAGRNGPARANLGNGSEDFISGLLSSEVGAKVSGGLWGAVGSVRSFASKSKSFVETKVAQAQEEGWVDTVVDVAKQGANAAVETSTWAAQKGAEAGKTTITFVNEGGGTAAINKTSEALSGAARNSLTAINSGADWLTEQLVGNPTGKENAAGLQKLSTGRMQGFGSDGPVPTGAAIAEQARRQVPGRRSYHEEPEPMTPPGSSAAAARAAPTPLPAGEIAPTAAAAGGGNAPAAAHATTAAKVQIWDDDEWGDWN